MTEQWNSEPLQRLELGEQTTPWDQIVLFRIRSRLADQGLTFQIRALQHGWGWSIRERSGAPSRTFESLHQALYHADAYTATWYPELAQTA